MAFRAPKYNAATAFQTAIMASRQLTDGDLAPFVALASAGPVSWEAVALVHQRLIAVHAQLGEVAGVAGVAQYARDQFDDPAYDVAQEFADLRAAIASAGTWITNNIPATVEANTADGITQTYAAAATAPLVTLLQAVIDQVNTT